jgi:hypothetical protein
MTPTDEIEGFKGAKGPYVYRPKPFDDWGTVRGRDGGEWGPGIICQARDPDKLDAALLAEHRANKTDPWEDTARLLAASYDLALFAQKVANTTLFPDEQTKVQDAAATFVELKREARALLSQILSSDPTQ